MAKSAADDTIDDIESDSETTSSGMMNEHNGSLSSEVQTDRYGFTGGSQYTAPELERPLPVDVIRKRELKWIEMFENWDKYMNKKYKKVKERCRKGIPPSLRARAWEYLCGAKFLKDHYKISFTDLESQTGDPKWIDDIQKDLHRQFPFHEMFASKEGHGQEDLFKVLKAYSIFNPADGYCQAQAPIAAVLLMHMPAEQAFWCLVSICEKYLPGYYSPGLEAVQIDGDILNGLLKRVCPLSYKHLKHQKLEPILYMTEWFMCVFSRTLPWSSVLRVWDMFFCEGVKVMFRIALVFFKFVLNRPEVLKKCPTMYETMERLRNISAKYMQADFLVMESLKLRIDEHDMEKEHQKTIARRRAMREQNNIEAQKQQQLQRKKKNKSSLSSPTKEH